MDTQYVINSREKIGSGIQKPKKNADPTEFGTENKVNDKRYIMYYMSKK